LVGWLFVCPLTILDNRRMTEISPSVKVTAWPHRLINAPRSVQI